MSLRQASLTVIANTILLVRSGSGRSPPLVQLAMNCQHFRGKRVQPIFKNAAPITKGFLSKIPVARLKSLSNRMALFDAVAFLALPISWPRVRFAS